MANNNIIGEEFEDYVQKQINVRQKKHGSGTPLNPRSIEDLNYLNSKTAWVKLASGVKISEERLKTEGMDASFQGMELAKKRVLFGGVASLEGDKLIQRGTNENGILNITNPNSGTYNVNQKNETNDLEFGLVPMPGITSVDIKNKNRGSIKEATVKLTAYTREQFDFIDLLYMRLGYTVFLEWGWSTYFDNSEEGNYRKMNYTLIEDKKGFFNEEWGTGGSNDVGNITNDGTTIPILTNQQRLPYSTPQSSQKGFNDFLPKISEYRNKYSGNYDGLLAKVRNFDWTLSSEGTYDITLSLISMGDVIESLKVNIPPTAEQAKILELHRVLHTSTPEQSEEGSTPPTIGANNIISSQLLLYKIASYPLGFENFNDYFHDDFNEMTYRVDGIDSQPGAGKFIPLGTTLDIKINRAYEYEFTDSDVEAKNKNLKELKKEFKQDINDGNIIISYDHNRSSTYFYLLVNGTRKVSTGKETPQNSLKPQKDVFQLNYRGEDDSFLMDSSYFMRLGLLLQFIDDKAIPLEESTRNKIINIHTDQWDSNRMFHFPYQQSHDPKVCIVRAKVPISTTEFVEVLPQLPGWHEEGNSYAWLMNIYVNFQQIESSINDNLDEEGNLSLFDFLSSLCTAINEALGGVNNLEPVIDEETNTIRIIDGSYTREEKPKEDYSLELYGYNNTNNTSNFVRNFSIKSTVSKEYASMISIGATAAGYTKGMEATMFSKWNIGITDRFKEKYVPSNSSSPLPTGSLNEAVTNYIENVLLKPQYNQKTDGGVYLLDSNLISTQVVFATEFYKYCQSQFHAKNPKYGSPTIGFIPISLNLSMDGISGMKIYNVVRANTSFLPKNYTDSLRFITKSVNHKLSNNDWETSIDTMVIPENYDKEGDKIILPYAERLEEVKRILIESVALKYGLNPKTATRSGGSGIGASGGGGNYIADEKTLTSGWPMRSSQYSKSRTKKTQIYLHHDAAHQRSDKGEKCASILFNKGGVSCHAMIDIDGHVERMFDDEYISYCQGRVHPKVPGQIWPNSTGLSIELAGLGYERKGVKFDIGEPLVGCVDWRGFPIPKYKHEKYQDYSDSQIIALKKLLKHWLSKHGIPFVWEGEKTYKLMFPPKNTNSPEVAKGKPGIWTHNSVDSNKSDVFPSLKLIKMFMEISNEIN